MTDAELMVWFDEKYGARASGGRWTEGFLRKAWEAEVYK